MGDSQKIPDKQQPYRIPASQQPYRLPASQEPYKMSAGQQRNKAPKRKKRNDGAMPTRQQSYGTPSKNKTGKKSKNRAIMLAGIFVCGCVIGANFLGDKLKLPWIGKDEDPSSENVEYSSRTTDGENFLIIVPDLKGQSMYTAIDTVSRLGINYSTRFINADKSKQNRITDQSIEAGSTISPNEELILTFGVVADYDNKNRYNNEGKNAAYITFSAKERKIKSWSEAEEYCRKNDGHLVVINSEYENSIVYSLMLEKGVKTCYIGYSKNEGTGKWQWSGDSSSYTNWNQDEPADGEDKNYAKFNISDGSWETGDFSESDIYFICEQVGDDIL